MDSARMVKNTLLYFAQNRMANRLAKQYGLKLGAKRFVAGTSIDAALQASRELNAHGMTVTLDHLGESVANTGEAHKATQSCLEVLNAIGQVGIKARLSIKLTQLGLGLDRELCLTNVLTIVENADRLNNFVRIDMEDFRYNAATLEIYRRVHRDFPNSVGIVLQASLFKTKEDALALAQDQANVRLVKGAYRESSAVAWQSKSDIDSSYLDLLRIYLRTGNFTAIATHDDAVIETIKDFIHANKIPLGRLEFQMLYGIRSELAEQLVRENYPVRIYVPFGNDWFAYFMRRLAERPSNMAFLFRRDTSIVR
ncbi:MAG: proline dehydrogenase family protein [Sulfobacillus sp.]